jgi:hypothetical protein
MVKVSQGGLEGKEKGISNACKTRIGCWGNQTYNLVVFVKEIRKESGNSLS